MMNEQTTNEIIYMEEPVWRYRDFGSSTFKTLSEPFLTEQFGLTFYTSTYICPSCHGLLLKSNAGKRVQIKTEKNPCYELTSVFLCPKCNFLFAASDHEHRLSDGRCWFLNGIDAIALVVTAVERVADKIMTPCPYYSGTNGPYHHSAQLTREEMLRIGQTHYQNGNYEEALRWHYNAAELGLAEAQYGLAVIWYNEVGVKDNYNVAAYWLSEAAQQGLLEAQDQLAYMYETGRGVEKSDEEAMKWWLRAANSGHVTSQGELGRLLMKLGQYDEGIRWLLKASKQGDKQAEAYLRRFQGE